MEINKEKYILGESHYVNEEHKKTKIILTNSLTPDMRFFEGWKLRRNGKYKKVTPYTVDKDGTIYQHFNSKYYSEYMNSKSIDKETILINLVNEGWLTKDAQLNRYKDWSGNIYKGKNIIKKEWRGYFFWAPYVNKQMEAAGRLVEFLCDKYEIEKNSLSHNVMFTDAPSFNGVLSRSNFSRKYKDVSPSFDFSYIDNKLLKEIKND
tara:strand:+ start:78 stop:698 length:621 start_codon:yes stop_codon:yes gene_type:complete